MWQIRRYLDPKHYYRVVQSALWERRVLNEPNLRGMTFAPPGHFYSPLLDIQGVAADATELREDGPSYWENLDLRPAEQNAYFDALLDEHPPLPFPELQAAEFRYYTKNNWFPPSDAYTLSAILRKEQPRKVIEVGSGFSSAVMLDTLDRHPSAANLTFIEPNPERLHSLLSPEDKRRATILRQPVQDVALSVFQQLEPQDVLFIDSSHVAKIGSDVAFLLLRVLPRLQAGVLVHVHDIFYPHSYPVVWIQEGCAWNESLFLRAFLMNNHDFQVVAFNSFATKNFPEVFASRFPQFNASSGGSLWLRKIA